MVTTERQHRRRKKRNDKVRKGTFAYWVRYVVRFPSWILYKLFDYRWVYVIRSSENPRFHKIGIGWNLSIREMQIDRSIDGSHEYVHFAVKLFNAEKNEHKLQEKFKDVNFRFKGSGQTEWFEISRWKSGQITGRLKLMKARQQFQQLFLISTVLFFLYLHNA